MLLPQDCQRPKLTTVNFSLSDLRVKVIQLPTLRPNLSSLKSLKASIRSTRATQSRKQRHSLPRRVFKRLIPRISFLRPMLRLKAFFNLDPPILTTSEISMKI